MDFATAIRTCFSKYAVFSGRARRSEYWYFVLFGILVNIGTTILETVINGVSGTTVPISGLVSLGLFLPQLAVNVRRLHDTGWSGWLIGGFYIFVVIFVVAAFAVIDTPSVRQGAIAPAPYLIVFGILGVAAFGYAIFLFVLTVLPGTDGTNRYGPDPKAPLVDVF